MRASFALAAVALLTACRPDFGLPASLVAGPRLLAVRSIPAEAAPGAPVQLEALAVSPAGTVAAAPLRWAFCTGPKPLVENNVVGTDCFGGAAQPIGDGPTVASNLPIDACLLFGPETPPQQPGQPPFRPRDPDVTGGYYQPVRLGMDGELAIGLPRILCNLTQASADIARDYRARYRANQNPRFAALDAPQSAGRGERISLRVQWPPDAAERYLLFDVASQSLLDRREALRVAWFATAGSFESDTTGRGEDDLATDSSNSWTAPPAAGVVHLWAVLRDSRGGIDFRGFDVEVR